MKLIYILLFSIGFTIITLVSCQLMTEPVVTVLPATALTEKVQSTTIALETTMPTSTIMIQPTTTVVQTASPSQTPLSEEVETSTLEPTLSPTPTPLPTLSPDEAIDRVLFLLHDNNNPDCLFPCWWGAVPGQTQWRDISPQLKTFALEIDDFPEKVAFATFIVPENIEYTGKLYLAYGINPSEFVTSVSIPSVNIAGYDPRTMMNIYGVPDEIWLKTYSEILPGGVLPFQLIIIYQEKGISFRYYVDAVTDGETVTVCFERGAVEMERPDLFPIGPRIYLWEPEQHKTIDEIVKTTDETYYPLEEKTDLTPQTFYEKFTNPNESPCIDTPTALWN